MVKKQVKLRWIEFLIRLVLGSLFIYSGIMKLLDPAVFQVDILNFELVLRKTAAFTALYLPWLKILCGIALIGWIKSSAAPLLLSFLMFIFIAVIGSAWIRELDVSCGCLGASDSVP